MEGDFPEDEDIREREALLSNATVEYENEKYNDNDDCGANYNDDDDDMNNMSNDNIDINGAGFAADFESGVGGDCQDLRQFYNGTGEGKRGDGVDQDEILHHPAASNDGDEGDFFLQNSNQQTQLTAAFMEECNNNSIQSNQEDMYLRMQKISEMEAEMRQKDEMINYLNIRVQQNDDLRSDAVQVKETISEHKKLLKKQLNDERASHKEALDKRDAELVEAKAQLKDAREQLESLRSNVNNTTNLDMSIMINRDGLNTSQLMPSGDNHSVTTSQLKNLLKSTIEKSKLLKHDLQIAQDKIDEQNEELESRKLIIEEQDLELDVLRAEVENLKAATTFKIVKASKDYSFSSPGNLQSALFGDENREVANEAEDERDKRAIDLCQETIAEQLEELQNRKNIIFDLEAELAAATAELSETAAPLQSSSNHHLEEENRRLKQVISDLSSELKGFEDKEDRLLNDFESLKNREVELSMIIKKQTLHIHDLEVDIKDQIIKERARTSEFTKNSNSINYEYFTNLKELFNSASNQLLRLSSTYQAVTYRGSNGGSLQGAESLTGNEVDFSSLFASLQTQGALDSSIHDHGGGGGSSNSFLDLNSSTMDGGFDADRSQNLSQQGASKDRSAFLRLRKYEADSVAMASAFAQGAKILVGKIVEDCSQSKEYLAGIEEEYTQVIMEHERLAGELKANADDEIAALREEIDVLREQLIFKQRDIEQLNETLDVDVVKLEHLENENSKLKTDNAVIGEQVAKMSVVVAEISHQNIGLAESEAERNNLKEVLGSNSFEQEAAVDEGIVERLQEEISELKDDLTAAKSRLIVLENELQMSLGETNKYIDILGRVKDDVLPVIEGKEREIAELIEQRTSNRQKYDKDVADLQIQMDKIANDRDRDKKEFSQKLRDKEDSNVSLQTDLAKARSDKAHLEKECQKLKKDVEDRNSQLADAEAHSERTLNSLMDSQEHSKLYEQTLQEMSDTISKLKADLLLKDSELQRVVDSKNTYDVNRSELDSMNRKLNDKELQLNTLSDENSILEQKILSLNKERESLKSHYEESRRKENDLVLKIDDLSQKLESFQQDCRRKDAEVKVLKESIEADLQLAAERSETEVRRLSERFEIEKTSMCGEFEAVLSDESNKTLKYKQDCKKLELERNAYYEKTEQLQNALVFEAERNHSLEVEISSRNRALANAMKQQGKTAEKSVAGIAKAVDDLASLLDVATTSRMSSSGTQQVGALEVSYSSNSSNDVSYSYNASDDGNRSYVTDGHNRNLESNYSGSSDIAVWLNRLGLSNLGTYSSFLRNECLQALSEKLHKLESKEKKIRKLSEEKKELEDENNDLRDRVNELKEEVSGYSNRVQRRDVDRIRDAPNIPQQHARITDRSDSYRLSDHYDSGRNESSIAESRQNLSSYGLSGPQYSSSSHPYSSHTSRTSSSSLSSRAYQSQSQSQSYLGRDPSRYDVSAHIIPLGKSPVKLGFSDRSLDVSSSNASFRWVTNTSITKHSNKGV